MKSPKHGVKQFLVQILIIEFSIKPKKKTLTATQD